MKVFLVFVCVLTWITSLWCVAHGLWPQATYFMLVTHMIRSRS